MSSLMPVALQAIRLGRGRYGSRDTSRNERDPPQPPLAGAGSRGQVLPAYFTYSLTLLYIHPSIHPYIRTYIHAYMHTYIHTYMHACIHTYIHTCIHTYISGSATYAVNTNGSHSPQLVFINTNTSFIRMDRRRRNESLAASSSSPQS